MNLLSKELYSRIEKVMPHVIDAFTTVYGEKYRSIIIERLENTCFVMYDDVAAIENYLNICKMRQLPISSYDEERYSEYIRDERKRISDIELKYINQIREELSKQGINFSLPLGLGMQSDIEYFFEHPEFGIMPPPFEVVEKVRELRLKAYEEFIEECISTSPDFIENLERINDSEIMSDPETLKEILREFKGYKNMVAINSRNVEGRFVTFLVFSMINQINGKADYLFLHEVGHAIENKLLPEGERICGFDIHSKNSELNRHNFRKRKYERLNETINDIFAIEAREELHKRGIYILEPKEFNTYDYDNITTAPMTRALVYPFVERYREAIIEARINGDMEGLYKAMGGSKKRKGKV